MQYNEWLKELPARERLWKRRLGKMERFRKTGNLLDIGTGIGQFLSLAKGSFTEVMGTEVSESAIEIAQKKYGLTILHGQAETMDFQGKRFDNITLFHVLEHVGSPKQMISKCHAMLNPQGILFIAVPNDIASLGAVKRRLVRRLTSATNRVSSIVGLPKLTLEGKLAEIHLSHFTQPVLTSFMKNAGFTVLQSSLDPFYCETGLRLLKMGLLYQFFSLVKALTGVNVYGTIWICARKQ